MDKSFSMIVALTGDGGIGYNQGLPWTERLSVDMTFFRMMTTEPECKVVNDKVEFAFKEGSTNSNVVIMGRKTFDSVLPLLGNPPFKNRLNYVLSSSTNDSSNRYFSSLDDALTQFSIESHGQCYVIGGGQIYKMAISTPSCKYIFATMVIDHPVYSLDTWFPTDVLNTRYTMIENITYQALQVMLNWHGTGKQTKITINQNLDRISKDPTDPYVLEHGLKYQFLLYKHI
jgi:dihydrofolate reductase